MALVIADRVRETSTTTGTGAVTLAGAATGCQTFSSAIGNGNTTYYTIADQGGPNWEVGLGTYSSSGNTLARTTVLSSSNAGSLVTFTAGTKDVFVTYPAEVALYSGGALGTPSSGTLTNCTFPTLNQDTTGTAANLSGTPTLPSGTTLVAPVLGTPASGTLTNCTNAVGYSLKSATTTVSVSAATAPSTGQVLTATSSTAATWQTPSSGGGVSTGKSIALTFVLGG